MLTIALSILYNEECKKDGIVPTWNGFLAWIDENRASR